MKRSRLVLGVITLVLGIVAFAAAKRHNYVGLVWGYYTSPLHHCTLAADGLAGFTQGASGSQPVKLGVRNVYAYTPGQCFKVLYTSAYPN